MSALSIGAAQGAPLGGSVSAWLPSTAAQWPLVVGEQTTRPETLTRGVAHYSDTLQTVGGQQRAQVLTVDMTSPNVRAGVVEAHDHIADPPDETISSMGNRTSAVAGINGDFFNIYGNGSPEGMVIENGRIVKSPSPNWPADFSIRRDGSMAIGTEAYSGTLTDGSASHALDSVNTTDSLSGNGITRVTPDLGSTPVPASTVVEGHTAPGSSDLVVDSVQTGVTSLPALSGNQEDLVGAGSGGAWLSANVHPGDTVKIAETISPDSGLAWGLSGGAILVQNGTMAVPVQGGGENNINDPVTGLGITADGRHAIIAVFDGHQPEDAAGGLTRPQLAQWMIAHGARNAILFDSGGSSEMVGREPGQTQVAPLNTPSDGHERPVANGLFFYSTAAHPGVATSAVVNGGKPLTVLAGSTVPVSAYARDAEDNPASDTPHVWVWPDRLGSISGGRLTAGQRAGRGRLVVRAGSAWSTEPLDVVPSLGSLNIAPSEPNLDNGATQQFTDSATTPDGSAATLPAQSVHWSVSPASLGTVDGSGLFTAASSGSGLATVTASAGGTTASTTVAVGQTPQVIDPMTDVATWALNTTEGATATLSESTTEKAQPSDAGSMDINYTIPGGQGVKQVVFDPKGDLSFPAAGQTQNPQAVGLWVKGQGTSDNPSTPLSLGNLTLAESYAQVNGQSVTFYPTTVTYSGWRLIVAPLPAGTQYPLSVSFLDFLVINPASTMSGHLYVSDLQALYSPRPPKTFTFVPVPDNPRWLQYTEDPAAFRPGGTTLAALDDAHMHADDTGSTGSVVMGQMPSLLGSLPRAAHPNAVQALGDMSDTGTLANLQYSKSKLDALGLPYRDAVGNHEITQGADPETGNFAQVFGPTHYAYDLGQARVIVIDSAHGGVLASDPFQTPAEEQYAWLVNQLSTETAKVTFVITHMPAYDPHPVANSQFADRYEAQEYEALLARFQQTHPRTHLIALFGHARGYAEQLLNPQGDQTAGGLPNFTVADAGTPPYAPSDQGGFFNYALFHINPDGTVQFAVQPVLSSIAITVPQTTIAAGAAEQLTATGQSPHGDDMAALSVPIADPASHVWSSSDPRVATVDPRTGRLSARHPGAATISVTSGGVTATTQVTVTES